MAEVELARVRKAYGAVEVIPGIDLTLKDGEFTVFVGPSGCGKSTLLRMIAGLEPITGGELRIGGARMNDADPIARGVAMVFQNYALYPHMTVADNIGFALRMAGVPRDEIRTRVEATARTLQIDPLLARKPAELSGGQRQRVAIGRAIVREPRVFLFDEPLSNLDAELRVSMRVEIARLHQRLGATMIFVTHDQTEAMTLANRIVVLRAGRVEQAGAPDTLYDDPDNLFVAGFIGSPRMNFLRARPGRAGLELADGSSLGLNIQAEVTVGIRPEHLVLGQGPLSGRVELVENLGATRLVHLLLTTGEPVIAEWRQGPVPHPGDILPLMPLPGRMMVFGADGQRLRLS